MQRRVEGEIIRKEKQSEFGLTSLVFLFVLQEQCSSFFSLSSLKKKKKKKKKKHRKQTPPPLHPPAPPTPAPPHEGEGKLTGHGGVCCACPT